MEYQILQADSTYDLEKDVNKYIAMGWKPIGGIAVIKGFSADTFLQVIIRD